VKASRKKLKHEGGDIFVDEDGVFGHNGGISLTRGKNDSEGQMGISCIKILFWDMNN